MDEQHDILFTEITGNGGNLGLITLNRPHVLNSLNSTMISTLYAKLQSWSAAAHIKAVVIRAAAGRAFCAGGDLRLTYEYCRTQDPLKSPFFHEEYALNRCIFHFPKPYIALLDGITMGGGAGISVHGSHRVATERLVFAMPETGIGFFPDVGGTYFLPRLPGKMGFYLGLTGAKLTADEAVALGIAQQKVSSNALPELIDTLASHPIHSRDDVTHLLKPFAVPIQSSSLLEKQAMIDTCFEANSIEAIIQALKTHPSSFCEETERVLSQKSPTSLKVTLEALQRGLHLDFDACMQQETLLCQHFLQGHDFLEGIRALIIDKDQRPDWQPHSLAEVAQSTVKSYFLPLSPPP